jgi:hypothetical protein
MNMKIRTFIAALVLAGMFAACTQKTCPTYTKDDVKKVEQAETDA